MELNIGVLVVGSLYWEGNLDGHCAQVMQKYGYPCENGEKTKADIRRNWRDKHLSDNPTDTYRVLVPIRYGRKALSRGNSYAMVFSPDCVNRQGTARAIRCSQAIESSADLIREAEELWIAESGSNRSPRRVSAEWGSVVLLVHQKFLDHPARAERKKALDSWRDRTKAPTEPDYGKLGLLPEELTEAFRMGLACGQLRIPWPQLVEGGDAPFDLLLATATDPGIGKDEDGILVTGYPGPATIGEAWNSNRNTAGYRHSYYFLCNRAVGITTADDDEILLAMVAPDDPAPVNHRQSRGGGTVPIGHFSPPEFVVRAAGATALAGLGGSKKDHGTDKVVDAEFAEAVTPGSQFAEAVTPGSQFAEAVTPGSQGSSGGGADEAPKPVYFDEARLDPPDDPTSINLTINPEYGATIKPEVWTLALDVFEVERVIRLLFSERKYSTERKRYFQHLLAAAYLGLCGRKYNIEAGRRNIALLKPEIAMSFPKLRDELWKSYFWIAFSFALVFGAAGSFLYYYLAISSVFAEHNVVLLKQVQAFPQICVALAWIPFGVPIGIFLEFVFRVGDNVSYDGLIAMNPGRWMPWRRTISTLITAYVFAFILGAGAFQIGVGSILLNEFISNRPWLSIVVGFVTGFTFPYVRDIVTQFRPERRDVPPAPNSAGAG